MDYLPLLILLLGVSVFFFWIPTEHLLYLHDAVYYLGGAESIASGKGYRCLFWEGEPPIGLYPPLQSFYLSLWWRLNPDFFTNAPYLQTGMILLWIILIVLFYFVLVDFSIPKWIAALISFSMVFQVGFYFFRLYYLSDFLGTIFVYIIILIAKRINPNNLNTGCFLIGICFALMFLTKTSALGFIIGTFIVLLVNGYRNQKYANIFHFTAPVFLAFIIWMLFPKGLSNYIYYFEYEYNELAKNNKLNTYFFNNLLYFLSGSWAFDCLLYSINKFTFRLWYVTKTIWDDIIVITKNIFLFSLWLGSIYGIYKEFKKKYKIYFIPVIIYVYIILIWPWQRDYRFMIPILPIICAGFYSCINNLNHRIKSILSVTLIGLLLLNGVTSIHDLKNSFEINYVLSMLDLKIDKNRIKIKGIADFINKNIEKEERIACSLNSPIYNLYKLTNRKFVPLKSAIDKGPAFEKYTADYYLLCVNGTHTDSVDTGNMKLVYQTEDKQFAIYKRAK